MFIVLSQAFVYTKPEYRIGIFMSLLALLDEVYVIKVFITRRKKALKRCHKEWSSGVSARLPPMWPGFYSRTRQHSHHSCSEGFLLRGIFSPGAPVFPPSTKTNISKLQFDPEYFQRTTLINLKLAWCYPL